MTRGNLLIVVVLVLALAGLFFWTLNLEQRLAEGPPEAASPDRSRVYEHRLEELETSVIALREASRSNEIEIQGLKSGLAKIEESDAAQARLLSGLSDGAPVAAAAAPAVDDGLKKAVETILREKEEKDRAERYERMARGWSRYLLADIEATDDQKAQFVKVVARYMDERGKLQRKLADAGGDATTREAELKALEEDRNAKILGIFGAADYSKIEERLSGRGRRRGDGRRPGMRSGR